MSLQARQDEWSELYLSESVKQKCIDHDTSLFGDLSRVDQFKLSALWVSDGISARHIDYPKSSNELECMNWGRSRFLRNLFNVTVIFQMFAPFFEASHCGSDANSYRNGELFVNGAPTRLALTILDMSLLIIYGFDLFLIYSVNKSRKSFSKKPWSTFRLFMCIFIFIDCLAFFADEKQPRICRCVFPFLLISRRNNLKLMSQGLLISGYHSLSVIKALFSVLLLWGFVGFVLFRTADTAQNSFGNPLEGFYTVLHCFTSRPYVLKALNPLYSVNEATSAFFVTLTLAADILCINLIVAVGSRQYKLFAASVFQQRLVDRRNAISCAFYAIAGEKNSCISKDDWMLLCENISGKYAIPAPTAGFIFDLVISTDQRERDSDVDDDKDEEDDDDRNEHVEPKERPSTRGSMFRVSTGVRGSTSTKTAVLDEELFFRCCALVAARLRIQDNSQSNNTKRLTNQGVSESSSGGSTSSKQNNPLNAGLLDNATLSNTQINSGGVIQVTIDGRDDIRDTFISAMNPVDDQRPVTATVLYDMPTPLPGGESSPNSVDFSTKASMASSDMREVSGDVKMVDAQQKDGDSYAASGARDSQFSRLHREAVESSSQCTYPVAGWSKQVCVILTSFQVSVGGGSFFEPRSVNVLHSLFLFMHVMLVLQLGFISSDTRNVHWFRFGWFLEVFFILYMVVKAISSGLRRYLSFYDNLVDICINLAVFVLLLVLGPSYLQPSYEFSVTTTMGGYLLASLLRLFKLFFLVNDVELFEHILPVLMRASFILYSVVYFFAIFGYSYFCDALNYNDVEGSSDDNNDASQWLTYENLLNFKSNLQSLFTMFEMGILGNWSMVMDAAALSSNPYSAYIFFYTFRLIITLLVMPILLSFILQAFLSALNKKAKSTQIQEQKDQDNAQSSTNIDSNPDSTSQRNDDKVVKEETVRVSILSYVDDEDDSEVKEREGGAQSSQHRDSKFRASFNISKGGANGVDEEDDSASDGETLSPMRADSARPSSVRESSMGSKRPTSSIDGSPSISSVGSNRSTVASPNPPVGGKILPSIQFGVDRSNLTKSKGVQIESIAAASGKKGGNQHSPVAIDKIDTSRNSLVPNSASKGGKDVTVQYDNNSSSMVSIWAQDGVTHSPANSSKKSNNIATSSSKTRPLSTVAQTIKTRWWRDSRGSSRRPSASCRGNATRTATAAAKIVPAIRSVCM